MNTHTKWSELKAYYDNPEDYADYFNSIDAEVASDTKCPICGKSLQYAGYRVVGGKSYVAIAYCEACDYAEEF